MAEELHHWFFHDEAEFLYSEVGGIPLTVITSPPANWGSRLVLSKFTKTETGWVKGERIGPATAQYISHGSVEVRAVEPDFFTSEQAATIDEPGLILPKAIQAELEVFRGGNLDGLALELGEEGEPASKTSILDALGRALDGRVDSETLVAYEMAYLRLTDSQKEAPEIGAFLHEVGIEVAGTVSARERGHVIAVKGQFLDVGEVGARLAADAHSGDEGAWAVKEQCLVVDGTYVAPVYVWVTQAELREALNLEPMAVEEPPQVPDAAPVEPVETEPAPGDDAMTSFATETSDTAAQGAATENAFGQAGFDFDAPLPNDPAPQITVAEQAGDAGADSAAPGGEEEQGYLVEYKVKSPKEVQQAVDAMGLDGDFSVQRLMKLLDQELAVAGNELRKETNTSHGQFSLVDGKVLLSLQESRSSEFSGWAYDLTDKCPGLAQFAQAAKLADEAASNGVSIGWLGHLDLNQPNSLEISHIEAYPYLPNGEGGLDAGTALERARELASEHRISATQDELEEQAARLQSGVFVDADTRALNFGTVAWYDTNTDDFRKQAVSTVELVTVRAAYSKAIFNSQLDASGVDDKEQIDHLRVQAGASLLAPGVMDSGAEETPAFAVAERIGFERLGEKQHYFVAAAGYGYRTGPDCGLAVHSSIRSPSSKDVDGTKYYTKADRGGWGRGSLQSVVVVGGGYFESKFQRIATKATTISPLREGVDGLKERLEKHGEKGNLPPTHSYRLQSGDDSDTLEATKSAGVGYLMADGSFGLAPASTSAVMALKQNGAFDRLMAYYQAIPDLDGLEHEEQKQRIAEHSQAAASGQLEVDRDAYFDRTNKGAVAICGLAEAMYKLDVSTSHRMVEAIAAEPEEFERLRAWIRAAIAEDVSGEFRSGAQLERRLDSCVEEDKLRKLLAGSEPVDTLAVLNEPGWHWMDSFNTADLPRMTDSILDNPKFTLIDKARRDYQGRVGSAADFTFIDVMHYTMPEVSNAVNQHGLIAFLRGTSEAQANKLTDGKDSAASRGTTNSAYVDYGDVNVDAAKHFYSQTQKTKLSALRTASIAARSKLGGRSAYVRRPEFSEYQQAGAPAGFALFMDRNWLDLPSSPLHFAANDLENYASIMGPMGLAFKQVEERLALTAEQAQVEWREELAVLGKDAEDLSEEQLKSMRDTVIYSHFTTSWREALREHVTPALKELDKFSEAMVDGVPYHKLILALEQSAKGKTTWGYKHRGARNLAKQGRDIHYGPYTVATILTEKDDSSDLAIGGNKLVTELFNIPFSRDGAIKVKPRDKEVTPLGGVEWSQLISKAASSPTSGRVKELQVELLRDGEDYRHGESAYPQTLVESFGLRWCATGSSLSDKERGLHANHVYDSFMDLAKILEIPPKALGLGAKLGIGIGVNGRGGVGAAMAHFQPAEQAINLTRMRGDGCFGHEVMHAICNHYYRQESGRATGFYSALISSGLRDLMPTPVQSLEVTELDGSRVSPELQKSFYELMVAIMRQPGAGGDPADIRTYTEPSDMLISACELDKGSKKAYWALPHEMFARAMESFIAHKMEQKEERNDYLVSPGVLAEAGTAYPTREAVERIMPFVEAFTQSLKTKQQLVEHKYLGAIEVPILYSKNMAFKPLSRDELPEFVATEFQRMFGLNQPEVSIESGLGAAGEYSKAKGLIRLMADGADRGTVYHEGWHYARDFVLGEDEAARVDSTFDTQEIVEWLAQSMREQGYHEAAIADAIENPLEAQAYAFEMWATGKLDMEELEGIYEKAKTGIDSVGRVADLLPPTELEAVFERIFMGQANQENKTLNAAQAELVSPVAGQREHAGMRL